MPLRAWSGMGSSQPVIFLSGPEGGFSPAEEALAMEAGFTPQSLGARILRAETAALAALALLA
jgi:16S rRNA (uracil1498-N3)-methyltransferase